MFRKTKHTEDTLEINYIPLLPAQELQDIERCAARVFSTDDGRKLLAYLQSVTFCRAHSATSTDEQLRYTEGQRALVASLLRLIERGRRG